MTKRKKYITLLLKQPFDINGGGVQRSTSKLAQIFSENGYRVSIISMSTANTKADNYGGIPIYYCSNAKTLKSVFKKEDTSIVINQGGYSVQLTKMILSASPTIKLINTLRINPLNFYSNHKFILGNLFRRKGVAFLDNPIVHNMILKYHILKQRYELRYIIKHTHAFVMLSDRFKAELYQLVPSVEKYDHKIFGISNPFKVPDINVSELRRRNVFLHVGRLEINQKRVDLLLEIWRKLHDKLPTWEFWVVGHGAEAENMQAYCKEHHMERVKFFGKQKPDSYYKQAKIFHLTSAYEGFGNVLVEAQSFGCVPILFDSYAAASEIINHKKDGVLVTPFDIDRYVEESIKLTLELELLASMRLMAYDNAKRFSYEKTYLKWDELFSRILACQSRKSN